MEHQLFNRIMEINTLLGPALREAGLTIGVKEIHSQLFVALAVPGTDLSYVPVTIELAPEDESKRPLKFSRVVTVASYDHTIVPIGSNGWHYIERFESDEEDVSDLNLYQVCSIVERLIKQRPVVKFDWNAAVFIEDEDFAQAVGDLERQLRDEELEYQITCSFAGETNQYAFTDLGERKWLVAQTGSKFTVHCNGARVDEKGLTLKKLREFWEHVVPYCKEAHRSLKVG